MNSKIMLSLATVALFTATASAYTTTNANEGWTEEVSKYATLTGVNGSWTAPNGGGSATVEGNVIVLDTASTDILKFAPNIQAKAFTYTVKIASLVSNASEPSVSGTPFGAITAVGSSWYGLTSSGWTALTPAAGTFPTITDGEDYWVKVAVKNDSGVKVQYSISPTADEEDYVSTAWLTAGSGDSSRYIAFSGCGSIGDFSADSESEITFEEPDTPAATAMGYNSATDGTVAEFLSATGDNNLPNWANYLLGLKANETKAPFAAPEQNAEPNKLTFKLGGIGNVVEGTTVTFTVESADSPSSKTWTTETAEKGKTESADVTLPDSGSVKYYRVKVKIQQ